MDPLPKTLFDILACPTCKGNLIYTKTKLGLSCVRCKRKYPIKDGIPILLVM